MSKTTVERLRAEIATLRQQLQGMVNEEAYDRDVLALIVKQKDALSVANQELREKAQALLDQDRWIELEGRPAGPCRVCEPALGAYPEYDTPVLLTSEAWGMTCVGYWRHSDEWIGCVDPTHWRRLPRLHNSEADALRRIIK